MTDPRPAASPRSSRAPLHLDAGRTRFVAEWRGDRWGHAVTVDGVVVAESIEGDADGHDPRWPASPAVVELSRVDARGRPAIVGVGLAGRSHFSLCLTAHPTLPDTLLFEPACRIVEPAAWLGSTYRPARGPRVLVAAPAAGPPPATIQWAYTIGPRGIEPIG